MNSNRLLANIRHSKQIWLHSLLLILVAVLATACSVGSEGLLVPQSWKGSEKGPTNPISAIDLTPAANIPDLPPDIVVCLKKPSCTAAANAEKNKDKTADELALACAQSDDERRACSKKVLKYYDSVQIANGAKKAAKAADDKAKAKQKPLRASELKKLEP